MKKMNKIKEALSKLIAETFERISTDKGILALDGALEDIEVGMGVSFVNEEGEEVAVEDGDYTLEDGRILRVAEGKIAEIVEPEAVEEPAAEEPANEEPVAEEAEEEAPAEEPEVENPTNTEEETETEAVVQLRKEVNELYSLVDALTKRVEELEKKPAASPASEEFRKQADKFSASKDAHKNFLADVAKA